MVIWPPKIKGVGPFEVAVLVVLWLGSLAIFVAWPWGRLYWLLPDGAPMVACALGLGVFLSLLAVAILNWRDRGRLSTTLLACMLFPIVLYLLFSNQSAYRRNRFASTEVLRGQAEAWIAKRRDSGREVALPEDLKPLTFGRMMMVSSSGTRTYYFPHVILFDNSEGLVYSPSGTPPERHSFWDVVRIHRLDEHWFWISTS